MQIIVNRWYQNTDGVKIAPQLYEANDPALHGLAAWLVENGYADFVKSEVPSPVKPVEAETPKRKAK